MWIPYQVAEVVIDMALERLPRLKISAVRTVSFGMSNCYMRRTWQDPTNWGERVGKVDIVDIYERDTRPTC